MRQVTDCHRIATDVIVMLFVVLPSLILHVTASPDRHVYKHQKDACAAYSHKHVTSPKIPDITGEWVSSRCEIRAGPEFVLRKYRFANWRFVARQYHFFDSDCTRPKFVIVARGDYKIRNPSWVVPGGVDAVYDLAEVTIMPYSSKAAELGTVLNASCPGVAALPWQPYNRYDVLQYGKLNVLKRHLDIDCMAALNFSMHELQLMRVEVTRHHFGLKRQLYLGSVHTERWRRLEYIPRSYQPPLSSSNQTVLCSICRRVANSNDFYPPRLHLTHHHHIAVAPHLEGEWLSMRCETRPVGEFVTRHVYIGDDLWYGYYRHFADPRCTQPMFTVFASGSLVMGPLSSEISGARQYDFYVQTLRVTPQDERILGTLSDVSARCGRKGKWGIGEERDVTKTGGCAELRLVVPSVELELLRMDKQHDNMLLFIGERPTIEGSPHPRPTSFQPPLVKCSASDSHQVATMLPIIMNNKCGGVIASYVVIALSVFMQLMHF